MSPQTVPKPSPNLLPAVSPVPYRRGRGRLGQPALFYSRGGGFRGGRNRCRLSQATTEVGTSTRWSTRSSWWGTGEKSPWSPPRRLSGMRSPSQVGSPLDGLEPVVIRQRVVAAPDPLEWGPGGMLEATQAPGGVGTWGGGRSPTTPAGSPRVQMPSSRDIALAQLTPRPEALPRSTPRIDSPGRSQ
jgi:hypothetical protein